MPAIAKCRDARHLGESLADRTSMTDPRSTPSSAPEIIFSSVSLTLGDGATRVDVLHDIDFSVAAGEAVAVVGPSGSGKTSLLALLAGLERPTTGTIDIAGRRLNAMSEDALAAFRGENVGIVFQNFHLIPTMTALENVAVPLELAGRADARAVARERLGDVGLDERLAHYPAQLSGGEQQRVAIARALSRRPSILVADEPTGNLDEATGARIVDLLFELRQREASTLVLVTHDPALAARCDRVVHMRSGRLLVSDAAARAARSA
jgi:putative ABC transport system ATP-binding protein